MEERKQMKPSEIYNKYWKVKDKNGNLVSPPPLTQSEADFIDEAVKNEQILGIFFKKRRRSVWIDIEELELQKFFPK